jgi:putative glutamine amidotransferase
VTSPERRPIVAVTLGRDLPDRSHSLRLAVSYIRALVGAGASPIAIAPGLDNEAIHHILANVDGLMLPGGVDPHPRHFDEDVHPSTTIDEDLDELELAVIAEALAIGMPILGICRGCQILNVAMGGSLIQDLAPGSVAHKQKVPLNVETHSLELDSASRLGRISATGEVKVNSFHHQAIGRVADQLRVVGTSEDGLAEAVESVDINRWIIGVQYHPEELLFTEAHAALFRAFVTACAQRVGGAVHVSN